MCICIYTYIYIYISLFICVYNTFFGPHILTRSQSIGAHARPNRRQNGHRCLDPLPNVNCPLRTKSFVLRWSDNIVHGGIFTCTQSSGHHTKNKTQSKHLYIFKNNELLKFILLVELRASQALSQKDAEEVARVVCVAFGLHALYSLGNRIACDGSLYNVVIARTLFS